MTEWEIMGKIMADEYKPKMAFPSYTELSDEEFEKQRDVYEQAAKNGRKQFEADVRTMLEADTRFNEEQRKLIFAAAFEWRFDSGFEDMLQHVWNYATFAANILAAQGGKKEGNMTNQEIIAKINTHTYEPKENLYNLKGRLEETPEECMVASRQAMVDYVRAFDAGCLQFEKDVLSMLEADYKLTERQRHTVLSAARERGCAAGFLKVLRYVDEYAAFAVDILEGQEN